MRPKLIDSCNYHIKPTIICLMLSNVLKRIKHIYFTLYKTKSLSASCLFVRLGLSNYATAFVTVFFIIWGLSSGRFICLIHAYKSNIKYVEECLLCSIWLMSSVVE